MNNIDEKVNEWRKSKSLVNIKEEYPRMFNSWRAFRYTDKGKAAGNDPSWDSFEQFFFDMKDTYQDGYQLTRIDKNLPFSKENCRWLSRDEADLLKPSNIRLTYNNQTLTIKEWAAIADTTVAAIQNRYHKHKNEFTMEEIIYGKRTLRKDKPVKDYKNSSMTIRQKASKMISAYKNKDKTKGLSICDIDIDWMIENIMLKPCIYCGDTERIGCDRIDNDEGHIKTNVVPCCYECNCARNANFSYKEMRYLGNYIRKIKDKRKELNVDVIN